MVDMKHEMSEPNESSTLLTKSDYPSGLCIYLDEELLKKLGIEELPEMGQEIKLSAVAYVKVVSSVESEEIGLSRSISLQITDLELAGSKEKKDVAGKMYKKGPDNGIKLPKGAKVVGEGYF